MRERARWMLRWLGLAVLPKMLLAFLAVLGVALIAQAEAPRDAQDAVTYWPILYAVLGGLVSGAIQYGAVRQTIRDHDRRITEARHLAGKAHDRLYELVRERE